MPLGRRETFRSSLWMRTSRFYQHRSTTLTWKLDYDICRARDAMIDAPSALHCPSSFPAKPIETVPTQHLYDSACLRRDIHRCFRYILFISRHILPCRLGSCRMTLRMAVAVAEVVKAQAVPARDLGANHSTWDNACRCRCPVEGALASSTGILLVEVSKNSTSFTETRFMGLKSCSPYHSVMQFGLGSRFSKPACIMLDI
ncbi:hypothetical protein BDZ45DRAFT_112607 [Acephala macrosclerotiorum]|nr:hypothetical protein BDZ45DRAFT_112607 [Acephala macrosclerotiorum]